MTDLRRTPSKPTWLTLRSGTRVRVLRHAACRVHGTERQPITALCKFPDGRHTEVHYSDCVSPTGRGSGGVANAYYGRGVSGGPHAPSPLGTLARRLKGGGM